MYVAFYYLQYSQDAMSANFAISPAVSENLRPSLETRRERRTKGLSGFQTLTLKNVCAVDLTPNYTVILYLFIILKKC